MANELTNPRPRRLAVLGSPIAHSKSPALHRAAYRALGLDWRYDAIEVSAGQLASFLSDLGPEWLGLSLTMPLKHEVIPMLGDLDRVAASTTVANTVLIGRTDDERPTFTGFNTDVTGLVRALADVGLTRAAHVTVLGAGATAASALVAAAELGAESVEVIVRTPFKAKPLVELGRSVGLVVTVSDLSGLANPDRRTDLVISTLPGGPVLASEFPAHLRSTAVLFDVSYSPWPSSLARSWQAAGGTVGSGLGMLLHQALIQVRLFVSGDPFEPLPGEDDVLEAMRGALAGEPVEG
ncbi:MAG: shikimate dehydrogenase [Cryobacterium sp.]